MASTNSSPDIASLSGNSVKPMGKVDCDIVDLLIQSYAYNYRYMHGVKGGRAIDMSQAKAPPVSPELAEAMTGGCHCLAARKRARRITRLYDEQLSPYGLTISQFGIMTMIASREEISVQELANALDLDQSALSRGLGPLEREGLVCSAADQADGRRRMLSVTASGLKKLSAAAKGWKAAQDAAEIDSS